jgi:hypothetical protein
VRFRLPALLPLLLLAAFARGGKPVASYPLDSSSNLTLVEGKAEVVAYRGRQAVHLIATEESRHVDGDVLALINGSDFKDGTIELEVAGTPRADAPSDARGFIGIAFRLQDQKGKGEYFYLRPTNARCDDQLRRNHSTQYVSEPDYPWHRLRKEAPGVYESYVDLDAGAWTKMKIVVTGTKAVLYVNGAPQPALVVNDLKLGETHGAIGLWAHSTTEAYFSKLTVQSSNTE